MKADALRELAARAGLRGVRPAVVVALACACCILLCIAAWRTLASGAGGLEVSTAPTVEVEAAGAAQESTAVVYVHVAGAVKHPGLVRLESGSRVADAIEECGGFLGDAALEAVNLARILVDGEQVLVPTEDQVEEGDTGPTLPAGGSVGKVDLNTATAAEFEELPGIGPATATKIVSDRETNGPFGSPDDLQRVPGIGPKKYEALKDLVTVR